MLCFSTPAVSLQFCASIAFLISLFFASAHSQPEQDHSWFEKNSTTVIAGGATIGLLLFIAVGMSVFYIYKYFKWRKEKRKVEEVNKYAAQLLQQWVQKYEIAVEQLDKKEKAEKPVAEVETTIGRITKTKKCPSVSAPLHMMTKSGKERLHYGRDIPREALIQKIVVSDDVPEKVSRTLAEETQGKKQKKRNSQSIQGGSIQLPSAARCNTVPPQAKGKNNSFSAADGRKSKVDVDASLSLTINKPDFQPDKSPSAMTLHLKGGESKDKNKSQESTETEDVSSFSMPPME